MDDALLARVRGAKVLWLLHVNADPDCVGSAFALREAFGGTVGAPDGLSKSGDALAKRLGLSVDVFPHPTNHDVIVAVDTSSRSQLGRLGAQVGDPCLVDHHRYGDLLERAPAAAWDPARASCAEVALALLDAAGHAPSRDAAFGLLVAILADTARFRYADDAALASAARLVKASGAKMEDAYTLLAGDDEAGDDDASLRKATLVAATRARIETWGDVLVATSDVGAFDAAAAVALVRAGADLAVVTNERSATARMSLRASRRLLTRGLHLGEVANAAARATGWSGGGHEGAAGLQGPPPASRARDEVVRLARERLEAR